MRSIGILGGSFDPPHRGHIAIASAAMEQLALDEIVFMPAYVPPHKRMRHLADARYRMEMLDIALQKQANMRISDLEIARGGISYTADTLHMLKEQEEANLTLLIGGDSLRDIHGWYRPDEIFRLSRIAVAARPGIQGLAEEAARLQRDFGADIVFLDMPGMDISSSEVRELLREGKNADDLLPPGLGAYIREHTLYADAVLPREDILAWLRANLKKTRYTHTLGVEQTARDMAEHYGMDAEKAALAALAHDCARGMAIADMQDYARRAGAAINEYNRFNPALLHAPAGIIIAQEVFGITDDEVLGAVRYHTTGKNAMRPLEKLLYVADMIEPHRRPFPGMQEIRNAAQESLEIGMRCALATNYQYLRSTGNPIHPDTMEALRMYPDLLEHNKGI